MTLYHNSIIISNLCSNNIIKDNLNLIILFDKIYKLTKMEGDFMSNNNINNDDICDIYSNKICDNCGKCLEEDGIDIRAINIDEIAKDVEENQYLEEELKLAMEALKVEREAEESDEVSDLFSLEDDDYIDAFENIAYLDEIGLEDNLSLDELTEEVYPGVLKLKRKL